MSKTGLSRTTLHNLEAAGKFPQHRLLTPRCAVWIESEVDQWLLDRLASPAAYAPLPNVALRRSTPGRGKSM
ncbi:MULTISPECIES: AlpA family phage regulatory protein [unclassified Rhizobacter]|uniref:helix-turn-helix transcriptional regulator n=1 Tax=unclassified Rhizobacter TaxID=2640088 RepID=UPI0009EBC780